MKTIRGFDYRGGGKTREMTRAEWRELLRTVIAAGGFRRAENGETYAHDSKGLIVFEVYAIIPA